MSRGFFVTGTDTGVGKTTFAAGLLAALRRSGTRVSAIKPAESGCALSPRGLRVPEDGQLLRDAAGIEASLEVVVPFRYLAPVAPAVAARIEDAPFNLDAVLAAHATLLAASPSLVVVEGAGGLLVPYSDTLLGADLAATFGYPLLIVARASLGTINHTLLTVFEARRRNLPIAAVVLNRVLDDRGPDEDGNLAEIARLAQVPVLGPIDHLPEQARRDPAALADAVARAIDINALVATPS